MIVTVFSLFRSELSKSMQIEAQKNMKSTTSSNVLNGISRRFREAHHFVIRHLMWWCTDPETGCYFSFRGTAIAPCIECGTELTKRVWFPTNRIQFRCGDCGARFTVQHTLRPIDPDALQQQSGGNGGDDGGDVERCEHCESHFRNIRMISARSPRRY